MTQTDKLQESAADLFKSRKLISFEERDPFNRGNMIQGFICRAEGLNYGSMLITHVNGVECPQVVWGTPKMTYPFDRAGRWNFPTVREILCYEKLDGTNILQYRYLDARGYPAVSYKVRLRPFVQNSRFGKFQDMWKEMLEAYPAIHELCGRNQCNISYEMYGARNQHLIIYDVPLAVAVLFGRKRDGSIRSLYDLTIGDIPTAPLRATITGQYVESYNWERERMGSALVEVEDRYKGQEGQVWYCYTEAGVILFKCKPEQIEAIHWASGTHLGRNAVIATCWNALENVDVLSYDFVAELLAEEFPPEDIDRAKDLIVRCVQEVKDEVEFKATVLEKYRGLGMSILADKASVMRQLSPFFPKSRMSKAYSIILLEEST